MKKIFYIFAAALVALTACTKEIESPSDKQDDVQVVGENGPMATLTFTATFPDTKIPTPTKGAMGDTPVIDNVYVAVFGMSNNAQGGNLQHWAPATLTKVTDASHTYTAEYSVTLPLTNEPSVVNFIVNYPSVEPPLFDREKVVLNRFYTEGDNGAYWQRVELPNGIKGKTKDGQFVLDDATTALLNHVHLVRNFAKITVLPTPETAEFDVLGYTLMNVPTQGNLAPMNNNEFDTPYMTIAKYCEGVEGYTDFVQALDNADYRGFMPSGAEIDTSMPDSTKMTVPSATAGLYMFERTIPTTANTQTAIIAKLQWKSADQITNPNNKQYANKTYFYKIEVIGKDGEYVPIRRNIWYKINLTGLEGDGEQWFKKAYTGAYFGNVSASIETATLNEITDNTSTIKVSRMDYTSVNGSDVVDI